MREREGRRLRKRERTRERIRKWSEQIRKTERGLVGSAIPEHLIEPIAQQFYSPCGFPPSDTFSSISRACKSIANNRAKCLAISQVTRAELYNNQTLTCLHIFFIIIQFHSFSYCLHIDLYQDPLLHMHQCLAWCLSSLFHIIKIADQLGYKPIIVPTLMTSPYHPRQAKKCLPFNLCPSIIWFKNYPRTIK